MKKKIIIITLLLIGTTLFAQEAKPCLFIGTYEKNKRGICGDYELVHEEVSDYAEFVIKRIAFEKEHTTQRPNTKFISANESVIAYQYEKKVSGWGCNSTVISTKTGKSIEECNKKLAEQLAKYPNDFTTQPKAIFSWQGKGKNDTKTSKYTKDYGGLKGDFTSVNVGSKSIILAQFTNKTKDKLAKVTLKTDNGVEKVEYIKPSATLTQKHDTKNLEITVIYINSSEQPTESNFNRVKNKIKETITNENGKIEKATASSGVRA